MPTLRFSLTPDNAVQAGGWVPAAAPRRPGTEPERPSLMALIRAAWRRRHSRSCLAHFDDRMLKDIGLTRADAELELSKPFWRD
ncbi:MAG TPA: DUF1127 domain-containing protein [Acetobacteraceae bacterium]|nr:DUF1127 domain-containing protein [Acetobacteraceae bacterium]